MIKVSLWFEKDFISNNTIYLVFFQCGHDFVAGKQFTLADVFFFPFLAWAWRMSLDFNKFPNIKKYFESVRERPSVKATWPPHWNEGEAQPEKMAYLKSLQTYYWLYSSLGLSKL